MEGGKEMRITIVILLMLIVIPFTGCLGISQEEYDMVKSELRKTQELMVELQRTLGLKQTEIKNLNTQLKIEKKDNAKKIEELEAKIGSLELVQEGHLRMIDYRGKTLQEYEAKIIDLESQLKSYEERDSSSKFPRSETIANYVEPTDSNIRNQALEIVTGNPSGINADADAWKIWSIFYWVSQNIVYVSDPKGREYYQFAHETLQTKAGDCDDFSILLASMYESVGLDSAIAHMDTDDEPGTDHMTCLVYWADDSQSFLDEENTILSKKGLTSSTGQVKILYWNVKTSSSVLGKYDEGIWITADGTMSAVRGMVGYVTHKPYEAYEIIDVGR